MTYTRKSSGGAGAQGRKIHRGHHAVEHWYRDNQIYFITARCHERFPAFDSPEARDIFWRQFDRYTAKHHFHPWVTSLIFNHYHTIGYLERGADLAPMMQGIHGSTAKLVNDLLEPRYRAVGLKPYGLSADGRLLPFWRDTAHKNYFDGCLRDEKQGRLTYRYVLRQSERHKVCADYRLYPDTHVRVPMEDAISEATRRRAFLYGVRYKRYEGRP